MPRFGRSCARWLSSVTGSVIDACISHPGKPMQNGYVDANRRPAIGARAPAPVLALPNQQWSLDFVHDQMASGGRFRVLNVVDDVTRECLRVVPDTSISGRRLVRELNDLIEERGRPG